MAWRKRLIQPLRSFRTKLRLILGAVILVAAIPIPITAMLRSETAASAQRAEASVAGLDQMMYLSTSITTLQVTGATYAQNPLVYNRERFRESIDSAEVILEGISFRSRHEERTLREVVATLNTEGMRLEQSVARGDADSGQRRMVRLLHEQGNRVSKISVDRAKDAQRSQRRIRREVREQLLLVHLLLGTAVLLLAVASWIIPKRLTERLGRLEVATQQLARGAVGSRVDVGGQDEVGRLARSFDGMSMALALRESENRQLIAEQVDRATRDSLTGLRNNRYFHTTLEALLAIGVGQTSVAVLDLDNFKSVNDTYGHAEGDAVLLRVAAALTETVRRSDVCCRLGGEEFAVIFPDCGEVAASKVMSRVASYIRAGDADGRSTTFSCGIATTSAGSAELLFKLADDSAYEAKRAGKDRIVIARDDAGDTQAA